MREWNESVRVGHQCHKWPLTLACGYGKAAPTNRFIATRQRDTTMNEGSSGGGDAFGAMSVLGVYAIAGADVVTCDVGACGSVCGACSACGKLFHKQFYV